MDKMKRICCLRLFSNSTVIPPDYYTINKTTAVMNKVNNEIMEIKLFYYCSRMNKKMFLKQTYQNTKEKLVPYGIK